MVEVWKAIPGHEGIYEVSNLGRVRSLDRIKRNGKRMKGRIVKLQEHSNTGYVAIGLYKDGLCKMSLVHRLVASAFIPNPNNLPEINHKDEDKTNNQADNLEWCNRTYNNNYGSRMEKMLKTIEPKMRKVAQWDWGGNLIKIYPSFNQASRETNISHGTLGRLLRGQATNNQFKFTFYEGNQVCCQEQRRVEA